MAQTRNLGLWETIQKTFFDAYRCAGMILQIVRVEGGLDSETLRRALKLLQQRHPLLRAGFAEAAGRPVFSVAADGEPFMPVPLRVLPLSNDAERFRIGEAEALRDFEPGCLWRSVMLEGDSRCDIVFLIHHAIADGHSIVRLVHDLLELCSALVRNEIADTAALPLLPAVESLLNRETPPNSPAAEQPAVGGTGPERFCFESHAPLQQRAIGTCSRQIEPADVQLLRTRCRSLGITPTGALTAALLLAAAGSGEGPRQLLLESGISLRRFCRPEIGPEHIGCYIMMLQTRYAVLPGRGFWDFAADCHRELQRGIALKQRQGFLPRSFHPAFVNAALHSNIAAAEAAGCFVSGLCFSNPGVLALEERYGPFRVSELYNYTCEAAGLWKIFLGTHVLHGRLYFDYGFAEPLVSRKTVEAIADSVAQTIVRQVRS